MPHQYRGRDRAIIPATAPIAAANSQPKANIRPTRMPTSRLDTEFRAAARSANLRGVKRKKRTPGSKPPMSQRSYPPCLMTYTCCRTRDFVPKLLHALLLGEIRKSCGTRSWSASGGHGTLSYHALDDRHDGGVKANAMEAVRFGRIVPALLVSTLHLRSAPWAFAIRDRRGLRRSSSKAPPPSR